MSQEISCANCTEAFMENMHKIVVQRISTPISKYGFAEFDLQFLGKIKLQMFLDFLTELGYNYDLKDNIITINIANDMASAKHMNYCNMMRIYNETFYPLLCNNSDIYLFGNNIDYQIKITIYSATTQTFKFSDWERGILFDILQKKGYRVDLMDREDRNSDRDKEIYHIYYR